MKKCHQALKQHDKLKFLNKKQFKCSTFLIVPHHHVTVLEIDRRRAWGYFKEGRFRDQRVGVKCVHECILNQWTMQRVHREISTMSQVHHPNLVLFIAAVAG